MPKTDLSVVATNACGWPNLSKLENGGLICVYFNAPSHGLLEGDLVCSIQKSKQRKWAKAGIVSQRPANGNRMHLAVGKAQNSDLLCFSSGFLLNDQKFVGFAGKWLSRSSDGGLSWTENQDPKIPQKLRNTIPFGRIISVGNNTLVYACYRSQGRGKASESWVCFSHDDGWTWDRYYKLGNNDSNEVALCSLTESTILAAVRTHVDHHVKICEFSCKTKRWVEKGAVTLPMQHPADLIKVGRNCLLMTYGLRNRGLMGLAARISLDSGKTWLPPWTIHQCGPKANDLGYPSSVSIDKQGNLLTAFYTDYEPLYKPHSSRYRVLIKRWNIFEWMTAETQKIVEDGM